MKRLSLMVGLLGILGASLTLMAQTPVNPPVPQPIPPGPLLKRAPDSAQWTVTFSRTPPKKPVPHSENGAPVELQQLIVLKGKTIYREERVLSNGKKTVTWRVGSMQIGTLPGSGELAIFDPSASHITLLDPEAYTDYSKTDFPGFEWISKKNYLGVQEIEGKRCLVFQDSVSDLSEKAIAAAEEATPEGAPQIPVRRSATAAWIDLETRLPVVLQKGNRRSTFLFGTPPQTTLTLPPKIQSLLERRAKALEMVTRKAARPY